MIGYKDKTFCLLARCKHWRTCDRALTKEVKHAAYKWWGDSDAPIAVAEFWDCCEEEKDEK